MALKPVSGVLVRGAEDSQRKGKGRQWPSPSSVYSVRASPTADGEGTHASISGTLHTLKQSLRSSLDLPYLDFL